MLMESLVLVMSHCIASLVIHSVRSSVKQWGLDRIRVVTSRYLPLCGNYPVKEHEQLSFGQIPKQGKWFRAFGTSRESCFLKYLNLARYKRWNMICRGILLRKVTILFESEGLIPLEKCHSWTESWARLALRFQLQPCFDCFFKILPVGYRSIIKCTIKYRNGLSPQIMTLQALIKLMNWPESNSMFSQFRYIDNTAIRTKLTETTISRINSKHNYLLWIPVPLLFSARSNLAPGLRKPLPWPISKRGSW